jgi:hypothetical protein
LLPVSLKIILEKKRLTQRYDRYTIPAVISCEAISLADFRPAVNARAGATGRVEKGRLENDRVTESGFAKGSLGPFQA